MSNTNSNTNFKMFDKISTKLNGKCIKKKIKKLFYISIRNGRIKIFKSSKMSIYYNNIEMFLRNVQVNNEENNLIQNNIKETELNRFSNL